MRDKAAAPHCSSSSSSSRGEESGSWVAVGAAAAIKNRGYMSKRTGMRGEEGRKGGREGDGDEWKIPSRLPSYLFHSRVFTPHTVL